MEYLDEINDIAASPRFKHYYNKFKENKSKKNYDKLIRYLSCCNRYSCNYILLHETPDHIIYNGQVCNNSYIDYLDNKIKCGKRITKNCKKAEINGISYKHKMCSKKIGSTLTVTGSTLSSNDGNL